MDPVARIEVMFEDLGGKFDAIMEYVSDIPGIKQTLREHDEQFKSIDLRFKVIESVVKQHSRRFDDMDKRFDRLEEKLDNHTHEAIVLRAQ